MASQAKRFGLEQIESEIGSNDGWVEFTTSMNTPEEVEFNGQVQENYSSIQVQLEFDFDWGYDSGTYIAGDGGPGGWYEQPGNYIENVNFYGSEPVFMFDGEEITREEFTALNQLADEDVNAIMGWCIEAAEEYAEDYIKDNPDNYSYD